MVAHIVCWRIKETELSRDENIAKTKEVLEALQSFIPELIKLEVGIDFNKSDAAYDLSLYTLFNSKEDLRAYQVHPEHQKVAEFIKSVASERVVVDYEL